ncbi:hypothetical protein N9M66_05680 [Litoreibacter sp.]|nr:hypothetical protein [Litoreibacter sp.]
MTDAARSIDDCKVRKAAVRGREQLFSTGFVHIQRKLVDFLEAAIQIVFLEVAPPRFRSKQL